MSTIRLNYRKLKMESVSSKLILAGVLFLLTLVTRVIVSHSSRPLNPGLVTLHKLMAAGCIVLVSMAAFQMYKTSQGKMTLEILAMVTSGILVLSLVARGALLTRPEMQLPSLVLKIHQVAAPLAFIFSTLSIYLLARGKS